MLQEDCLAWKDLGGMEYHWGSDWLQVARGVIKDKPFMICELKSGGVSVRMAAEVSISRGHGP